VRTERERAVSFAIGLIRHGGEDPVDPGVRRNALITATTGVVLLVLLAVQGLTLLDLHALIGVHLVVGFLLVGPLGVKIASTGYRMLRYYTGARPYLRKGPPHVVMRVMAPFLLVSTAVLMGSGLGLAIVGPARDRWLGTVHVVSFWIWIVLAGAHVLVYVWRLPRLLSVSRSSTPPRQQRSQLSGILLNVAGLAAASMLVFALLPMSHAWLVSYRGG
jgi:hypothetical protein